MLEFDIVFENYQSSLNGSPKQSSIFLDLVKFTNVSGGFNTIRLDHFGVNCGISGLGAQVWSGAGAPATGGSIYSLTNGQYTNFIYGLHMNYDNIPYGNGSFTGWVSTAFTFGGGADTTVNQPCDFSSYNKLTFYAKNRVSGQPHEIQVVIQDSDGGWASGYTVEATGGNNPTIQPYWQKITVPLSLFSGINFHHLNNVSLSINTWCDSGGSPGVVFIDQVQFEK